MPNQKQKDPEDSADTFFQPPNSNSVSLQQEVRLIVYSVLGVHGYVSLTCYSMTIIAATFNLLFYDNHSSHTMKCCVSTKMICSYASTVKLIKKDGLIPVKLMSSFWSKYRYFVARFARYGISHGILFRFR